MARKGSDFPEYAKWVRIYGGCSSLEEVIYKALISRQKLLEDEDAEKRKENMKKHRASGTRIVNHIPLAEVNEVRDKMKDFIANFVYGVRYRPIPEIIAHEELYNQFLGILPNMRYVKNPPNLTGDWQVPVAPANENYIEAYVKRIKQDKTWWNRWNEVENLRFLRRFTTWLDAGAPLSAVRRGMKT